MADLHTRTATFASLKCRSKCDIFASKGRVKNKGKRAVFPYDKASSRKPCLSLSSSIVLSQQVPSDKSRQHNRVPLPSLKIQQLFHHRKQKTASKFSLLLLHFSCALHFDLLFDRLDFFQSQLHEQSQTSNIFYYLTSQ